MRKLVPGWNVKGKMICVDCIEVRPKDSWTLIQSSECTSPRHHKAASVKKPNGRRRKTG